MFEELDYKWVLAGIAALISICNFGYYVSTIIKGKTKPHLYTWLIWSVVAFTAAAGQITDGGGIGATTTLMAGFSCLVVVVLSISKGSKNITRSDRLCLLTCFIALALWPLTKLPLLSVIIVTLIDLAGYIPTIRKSYNKPHEESIYIFSLFIVTVSLSLFALENYTWTTVLYLSAMNIANISMTVFLMVRRHQLGYKVIA